MVAVLDLVNHARQLAVQPLVEADAEDLADAIGGQPPQADLTTPLEDLMNGEVALEDEIPAVFDFPTAKPAHTVPECRQ